MACGVCAKVLIAVVIVIAATTATAREPVPVARLSRPPYRV